MAGITGKALHQLLKNPQWTADSWDALLPVSQNAYNLIADQLNAQYLAPLQGLVRDYQLLARESLSIESNGDLREWRDHKDALDDQAVALLNGEQKEG